MGLTFGRAAQADLAAKARAVGGLVKAGLELDEAMRLAWGRMTTAFVRAAQDAGREVRAALAALFAPVPRHLWVELDAAITEAQDALAGRLPTRCRPRPREARPARTVQCGRVDRGTGAAGVRWSAAQIEALRRAGIST